MAKVNETLYDTAKVLAQCEWQIAQTGYVTKKKSYETGEPSTADQVISALENEAMAYGRSDMLVAEELIKWVNWEYSPKIGDDFGNKRKEFIGQNQLKQWQIAYVAGISQLKARIEKQGAAQQAAKEASAGSDWIGTLKTRDEFFFKITKVARNDDFGSTIHNVVDRNGNVGVFWRDGAIGAVGECVLIKATPVKQEVSTYHGGRETKFNRVKLLENVGAKA